MRLPFCDHHISAFFATFEQGQKPLDLALSDYFRTHKSIGAHDRRQIGEIVFGMVRWKTLIDYLSPTPHFLDRLACYRNISPDACQNDPSLPESVRFGMNEYLYNRLIAVFGKSQAQELCRILNGTAPTTIRVNRLKTTREALLERWQGKFEMTPCSRASSGIQFQKREPLFSLPEFKEGLFEVQDEGSQLIGELIQAKPGDQILDYCSGSGGKTLAFAPFLKGKGQIYLYDIRPWVLQEARKRLRRAGIQNAQFALPKTPVDWVLVDVPCSGTGTLRRNVDAKWKIDAPMIKRLVEQQRTIVAEALRYLKPGGILVYSTCSILPEENQAQVEYFLKSHPLILHGDPLSLLPIEKGMDGFFSALLKKSSS